MKQLEIASNNELVDLINFLSSGQYPSRIGDSKAAKRTYRRFASRFFYCEKKAKLFVKNEDDSLLEYYGSFQESDKLTAIMRVHQSIGHLRRDKLTSAARELIYAPTADDIKCVLERCPECQMMFRIKTRPENKVIYAAKPGALYQADLIDLRVYTDLNDDFCWILNILDVYSKYLISVPLKAKNAQTVKSAFESSFLLFGEPKMLQTDNGKEFKNSLLKEFTDSLCIRRIFGRPRHPQTQGQVERVNQTLKRMMSALILERSLGNRWIGLLQECVAIYNRQQHDATGKKPIKVFFGREVGNPLTTDLLIEDCLEEHDEDDSDADKSTEHEIFKIIDGEIQSHRAKYEKKISKKRTWKTIAGAGLKINSVVLLKKDFDANTATKHKPFDVLSDGKRYKILAISDNGLMDIQDIDDTSLVIKNVTLDRICPFKE